MFDRYYFIICRHRPIIKITVNELQNGGEQWKKNHLNHINGIMVWKNCIVCFAVCRWERMQYICQFGSVCVCARAIMQTPVGRTIKMLIFIYHKRSICSHNIKIFLFFFVSRNVCQGHEYGYKKKQEIWETKKKAIFFNSLIHDILHMRPADRYELVANVM